MRCRLRCFEQRRSYEHGKYIVCLFDPAAVDAALRKPEVQEYLARMKARREKRMTRVPEAIPLIDAIREVRRSAHRWRDAAQARYQARNHGLAGHSKREKERLYGLKERDIADAESTLSDLPAPGKEFERTAPPRKPKEHRAVVCYESAEEGHIARHCPYFGNGDENWE